MINIICSECGAPFLLTDEMYETLIETTREVFCTAKGCKCVLMTKEVMEMARLKEKNKRLSEQNERLISEVETRIKRITQLENQVAQLENPRDVPTDRPEKETLVPTHLIINTKKRYVFLDGVQVNNRKTDTGCLKWSEDQIAVLLIFANNCGVEFSEHEFKPFITYTWKMVKSWVVSLNDLFIRVGGKKYLDLAQHQVEIIND